MARARVMDAGEEEVGTAGDPMLAVRGDPAARNYAM
jgi:hypothetical protein